MTPFTTNNATWPASRLARLQRMEIQQAKRELGSAVGARIRKPGAWVVWRDDDGRAVGEVFS